MSDGSKANNSAAVSNENGSGPTEAAAHPHEPHEPHIHVLKGHPTDEELAALVTALGVVGGGVPEPREPEPTRWGLPVDRLRFAMSNYQRLTFQQMTHMRH
ncbi:acyl-CoA carboxylase subunit epsilon [Mycobacterium sp. SMC-2]|uniref:acyl-CoA carboxylase subunit epsilon n=1 Tax=Mycobacterium sp. SMC-2 TaxID=2857058 RepID=UPI0021B35536|nr:acyl-CoA carboxylase subunit epsilon [Mycobacterium sp. SMC-2]UXA08200.1 acyl-CoA carboxylase subunit epsilon [Mycobacterium sp. SMC-2]